MVTKIYLNSTNKINQYSTSLNIKEVEYKPCYLFTKFDQSVSSIVKSALENIEIFIQKTESKKFTLRTSGNYSSYPLTDVEVYFNRYDSDYKFPLIVILYFSDFSNATPKFYKYSEFSKLLNTNRSKNIYELTSYDRDENTLLKHLLEENDQINKFLTFDLGKINTTEDHYNGKKIKLYDHTTRVPDLKNNGYKMYKHSVTNNENNNKACILYNNQVLLWWKNSERYGSMEVIKDVQNININSIDVYHSNKLKTPLLAHLDKLSDSKQSHSYYFIKKNNKGSLYWEVFNNKSFEGILGQIVSDDLIHTKLSEPNNKLIDILKNIETNILSYLIINLDGKLPYTDSEIQSYVQNSDLKDQSIHNFTALKIDRINVQQKRDCPELIKYKYKCFQHEINLTTINSKFVNYNIELRLLIPKSGGNGKYSEIKLYNKNEINTQENREYLILKKHENVTNLYVYFYNEDPRPLLLGYNGTGYKPLSCDDYDKWVKIDEPFDITCDSVNSKLITELSKVVKILNGVKLDKNDPYVIQAYGTRQISINVSLDENLGCYIKYTHTPDSRFVLGNIKYPKQEQYKSQVAGGETAFAKTVAVYYYKKDYLKQYPLLVEVDFNVEIPTGSDYVKKYYELTQVDSDNYSWNISQLTALDNTGKLLNKLFELNKQFNRDANIDGDYDCKLSHENDSTWEAIGATTGTIGAVGGIGFGIFKYNAQLLTFLKTLF